jgi:cationic peptide transport system substrate-binding protein
MVVLMMKAKRFALNKQAINMTLALALITLLSACSSEESLSLSNKSLVYCAEGSPESFNPQIITSGTTVDATANQLYNRLITFNAKDNSIKPSIAKSWHVTGDGKMVTFYLRKNIAFHHTDYFTPSRTLNADDVLFSFNRILDESHQYHQVSGGSYPFFQSVQLRSLIQEIERINDYTIRFKLHRSDSSFLANLATDFSVVLSEEYGQQLAKRNERQHIDVFPIGTGPFKLKEYKVGSLIRYYRHDQYWQGKVELEQLVFDITPSNTGRLTKLLTNECDVVAYPIAHEKIVEHPNLTLESVTSFNVAYLGFNTQKAPFNNIKVRQAIAYAINKKSIVDTIYSGKAEIAKSLLQSASWAYDDKVVDQIYSITKAKELLKEAGFENGFEMNIWAMNVQRPYNPNALTMAKLIQSDLKDIGVEVNIVSYEWATFLQRVGKGEHQTVLLGWTADHPDPDNFFTSLLSCAAVGTGNNSTLWCNEKFDELLQKALKTGNIEKRKVYYSQALAMISQEMPLLPLAHSKRYQARSNLVRGDILSAFGGIDFSTVTKVAGGSN